MSAHSMQPPKGGQPALALLPAGKALFTNLKTFVSSFCVILDTKNRGGVVASSRKKRKFFLLPPLCALPWFFQYWEEWEAKEA